MKTKKLTAGCIVLAMAVLLSFCPSGPAAAKENKKAQQKRLASEWGREVFFHTYATILKGKTYTLDEFLKIYEHEKSHNPAKKLRSKIKKGMKASLSGKGLTIKNKTFRAENTGEYQLQVKAENTYHWFRVRVVEENLKVQTDGVAKVLISWNICEAPWEKAWFEITDPNVIDQFATKLRQAEYTYDCPFYPGSFMIDVGYSVCFYDSKGERLYSVEMYPDMVVNSAAYWCTGNLSLAQGCYDYIDMIYKDKVSQMPKRKWNYR